MDHVLWSNRLTVQVVWYYSQCFNGGVYSEIIPAWREQMGTMRRFMGNIHLPNLSMNYVPIRTALQRDCKPPKWTQLVDSSAGQIAWHLYDVLRVVRCSLERFDEDGAVPSRHLAGRKDVQTMFGPAAVSKTLTACINMFDVILTHMQTLVLLFELCNYVQLVEIHFPLHF